MAKPGRAEAHRLRVAGLLLAEGYAIREVVHTSGGIELDVVAVDFSPLLERHVTVVVCVPEGRAGPPLSDRIVWAAGARRLGGASHAIVASARRVDGSARALAERLGVLLAGPSELDRRERAAAWEARSLAPQALRPSDLSSSRKVAAQPPELVRIAEWAISDGWLRDAAATTKRALSALRLLQEYWSAAKSEPDRAVVRELADQAIVLLALALVDLTGRHLRSDGRMFEQQLLDELAEGVADIETLRALSRHVDSYLMRVLTGEGVAPAQAVERLGVFDPQPPPYADQLLEVVERLAARPADAARLPAILIARTRQRARSLELPLTASHGGQTGLIDGESAEPLLRLVAAFLRGQAGVGDALLEPLLKVRRAELERLPEAATRVPADDPARQRLHPPPLESDSPGEESALTPDEVGHELTVDGDAVGRLKIGVRNRGDVARRVVRATVTLKDTAPVLAEAPVVIAAGSAEQLAFDVDAAALRPEGGRVSVSALDDDGCEHRLKLRYTETGVVRTAD